MAESEMSFEGCVGNEWCCGSIQCSDLHAEGTSMCDPILKLLLRVGILRQVCESYIIEPQFLILNV